jgi:ABC-type nitrate/sulfonate/bicarbonate transport system substrate-binding protein
MLFDEAIMCRFFQRWERSRLLVSVARVYLVFVFILLTCERVFALEDFLMGISTKHISIAYLYIGKERGIFAEEGIDLKLVLIPANIARTALVARQLDGMEFGATGITLRANGAPVVKIFSQSQKPGWFLLANPSITELKQLAGKALTVGALGSGSHVATVEILRKAGVSPDSVVFMGGIGGSDVRLQMLASGTVQAANLVSPYNFIAERMGFRNLLFYGDYFDMAQFGLVVYEPALETRKPFFKKVLRAFLRSHRYTLEHQEEALQWVLKNLKVEKGDAGKTVDVLLKTAAPLGIATDAAIQNALDPSVKAGAAKKVNLVDYTLLREVHRDLGIR